MSELIKPDFTSQPEKLSPGEYAMRIVGGEAGVWVSKTQGKPDTTYVKWILETFDEADSKNNGRRHWEYTPINGGGVFRFDNLIEACGMSREDVADGFSVEDFLGKEVRAVLEKDGDYIQVKTFGKLG